MVSIRHTETHVFFWGSYLSNFYQLPANVRRDVPLFRAALWDGGPLIDWNSSEQYLMASKALLFGNTMGSFDRSVYNPSLLEQIIACSVPKEQKAFGRKVTGFDKPLWDFHARRILFRALWAKFTQNTDLSHQLIDTHGRILVEGAPNDQIWGVGLAWDNPAIDNPDNWLGSNWLGEVLMQVRELLILRWEDRMAVNPFHFPDALAA